MCVTLFVFVFAFQIRKGAPPKERLPGCVLVTTVAIANNCVGTSACACCKVCILCCQLLSLSDYSHKCQLFPNFCVQTGVGPQIYESSLLPAAYSWRLCVCFGGYKHFLQNKIQFSFHQLLIVNVSHLVSFGIRMYLSPYERLPCCVFSDN